jgi:hypothetical protein
LAVAGGVAAVALAAGLSTHFGEVLVENLQIGRTYNTQDLIGLPLRVKNESDEPIELLMEPVAPRPDPARKDYEPIPDLSWVRLERTSHTVAPNAEAVSNVFLSIPADPKLKGRRFMVSLHSYTVPPKAGGTAAISVGLFSKLLFTVSRFEGAPSRQESARVFSVMPEDLFLSGVPAGKPVHSGRDLGKSLVLFNPNDFSCTYEVRSIPIEGSETKVRVGFDEAPDAGFLTLEEGLFTVPPHSEKTVFFSLAIPAKDEYRGRNFMFLLMTEQRPGTPLVRVYNRVFVFTE